MNSLFSHIKIRSERLFITLRTFFKWLLLSGITGVLCGLAGTAFHLCMEFATETRTQYSWLIFGLPIAGLAIVFLYHICGLQNDPGTNIIITSIRHEDGKIPVRMAPLIFISTFITHIFGGSAGREGAALQIGGGLSAQIARTLKMSERDSNLMIMCGMSGLFAALFSTPVTATFFAMEVISVGVFYYTAIVPCFFSAVTAFGISMLLGVKPLAFSVAVPELNAVNVLLAMLLGVCAAVVSMLFCRLLHKSSKLLQDKIKNDYIRIVAGGAVIVLLTMIFGTDYNGAGMDIISNAMNGEARPEAFALKLIFTVITISCGFKGGEIVPSFFIGATLGCAVGGLIGLPPQFSAALGLVALFCGVVNCPVSSLLLSVELFGAEGIIFFAAACAVSYILSGYYGLYTGQKIMYSKMHSKYINRHTK
ncbi:MAG: chloride channel protein [Eubacterium sp.]|nr:chloride channel protein [Eubacterium sp.]